MPDLFPNLLSWALDPSFLGHRMCFIAGPRQIGKTTLLQNYLASMSRPEFYFNWDTAAVRSAYHQNPDFFILSGGTQHQKVLGGTPATSSELSPVVFDEIHKYPRWKSHLKGIYDTWKGKLRFIVTGSARLDFMRKSGDSLVGRYFLFRKLPLHPRECAGETKPVPAWHPGGGLPAETEESKPEWIEAVTQLSDFNGFPEPFLAGSKELLNRWQTEHLSLLVTEDLADLTKIEQVLRVEELAERLRNRVGSPLSTNNLAEDLQAGFPTVKRWLDALELVYLTFRIPPYTRKLERAIRKEPKLYFWDWSLIRNPDARFENMVAVYLMKTVASWNERGLGQYKLFYVRTRDGIEVDFLVLNDQQPVLLVEAKLSDEEISSPLLRVKGWLKVNRAWQVIQKPGVVKLHREKGVMVFGLDRFLQLTS